MNTILIIGGSAGLGLAFAQRLQSQGKKVIITGREGSSNLKKAASSNPGLETYGFNVTDLESLPSHISHLFKTYPSIDTVWLNAGVQYKASAADPPTDSTISDIENEIKSNRTSPLILSRLIVPHLLSRAGKGQPASLWLTSSGLGFTPVGAAFGVYCATKAGIHSYSIGLRQVLKPKGVSVVEIVPPYVEGTELGRGQDTNAGLKGMTIEDYVKESFEQLDGTDAMELKEVSAGSAIMRVEGWRKGMDPVLEKMKLLD